MTVNCEKCRLVMFFGPDLEPTKFCNLCAQQIVELMLAAVPEPPKEITWEQGVKILNLLQKELYK